MIGGTVVMLDQALNEPIESTYQGTDLPAINVMETQSSFDDRPIQKGEAADRTETNERQVDVVVNAAGEPKALDTRIEPVMSHQYTEWVADFTCSGLLVIESIAGDGDLDFPLDLFWNVTGQRINRVWINIEELHRGWSSDGNLGNVWMRGADAGDGATIEYHEACNVDDSATIGLGFNRAWRGTVMHGVVYDSGYVALYNCNVASRAVRFIEDELLPFTDVIEDDFQAVLGETTDEEADA